MPKTLILITNHFPFGPAEAFIETEYPYLKNKFDKIIILSKDVLDNKIRSGNYTYYRVNPESNFSEKVLTILLFFKFFGLVLNLVGPEIRYSTVHKKLTLLNVRILLHDLSKALITSHRIRKIIRLHGVRGEVILYSYWLTSSALSTLFVRSKDCTFKRISRAHGGDIYEERHKSEYLSFRNSLAKRLDFIFCISQNGMEYLKTKIDKTLHNKLALSRLGTSDEGLATSLPTSKKIVVSCSFLVPVKRISFLIDSLALINEAVEWIHIGDGPLANELKLYADKKLTALNHIKFQFMGTLSKSELQGFYKTTPVFLFLNTSSSEGIPVTMMEAQSFGIPILGLDIGGVGEIVNSTNGRLLPASSNPKEFSEALTQMLQLTENEIGNMRKQARLNWSSNYNAERNFSTFADQISSLS